MALEDMLKLSQDSPLVLSSDVYVNTRHVFSIQDMSSMSAYVHVGDRKGFHLQPVCYSMHKSCKSSSIRR